MIAPRIRAATASGSTIQNIHRQLSEARIAPPIVGPMAGATAMTIVIVPIVEPRRSGGTRRMIDVISSGIITAVPHAWTTRPISRTAKPGASALMSVPRLNNVSDARKTCRGVNRSSRKPVVGMTTAIVSRKPLVSHCTVVVETPRSTVRSLRATDRIVSLRIMTNADTTRTAMTTPARVVPGVVAAGSPGAASGDAPVGASDVVGAELMGGNLSNGGEQTVGATGTGGSRPHRRPSPENHDPPTTNDRIAPSRDADPLRADAFGVRRLAATRPDQPP